MRDGAASPIGAGGTRSRCSPIPRVSGGFTSVRLLESVSLQECDRKRRRIRGEVGQGRRQGAHRVRVRPSCRSLPLSDYSPQRT